MANPYHHAVSSQRRWGGEVDDYLEIHRWFDASKELHGDFRHRALRHHTHGIFECERIFGVTITLSTGKRIPSRWVAEQHVDRGPRLHPDAVGLARGGPAGRVDEPRATAQPRA